MAVVTRFAPSPTGPLHLGHAFSALMVQQIAGDGTLQLRIEDIDRDRCRPEWERLIYDDLQWLGLTWTKPVMRQSERFNAYESALSRLESLGLTYGCTCSRADIRAAFGAPQEGVVGVVYPGTCRGKPVVSGGVIRLDMVRAMALAGPIIFGENLYKTGICTADTQAMTRDLGDVVLARRDTGVAYHLAVVVDDAAQGITDVVRGEDLFEATKIHVVLQRLLGMPTPTYHHHGLIRDENGKRLAKRDDARALAKYRSDGASPDDIRRMVGL